MPEIFSMNRKLKLIEYGSGRQDFEALHDVRNRILRFLLKAFSRR